MNKIEIGDCRRIMNDWIFDGVKVQMCVTSPPYFGLRDYGVDGQMGLEQTPDEYVKNMVEVFGSVRDLLADDGTLWLNLGDSYVANRGNTKEKPGYDNKAAAGHADLPVKDWKIPGKPKDLIGIPWRVAFALQADGWYLRQDIIWHKPNPMPESVTDRCTKAHEYIFLLTKRPKYFFDSEAIKEPATSYNPRWKNKEKGGANIIGNISDRGVTRTTERLNLKPAWEKTGEFRNCRDVWSVASKPYKGAHFACFPPDLIEPCILAGTSEKGHCSVCGARQNRIVEKKFIPQQDVAVDKGVRGAYEQKPMDESNSWEGFPRGTTESKTLGWRQSCDCGAIVVPDVVFDPFMGSGTTAEVALKHGRQYLGCESNPKYKELQDKRIASVKNG